MTDRTIAEVEDANARGGALIGEAMDELATGAPTARTVLTAIAIMGRARIALGEGPYPIPDDGCARCHLYRTELVAAIDDVHRARVERDQAQGHLSLLARRVQEWMAARAATIGHDDPDFNAVTQTSQALAGTARMLDDLTLLTDVIMVSREAVNRRDRTIAAYRLAECAKDPA